jgi:hypothetical protein
LLKAQLEDFRHFPYSQEVCKGLRRTKGFDHLVNTPEVSRKPQHTAKIFVPTAKAGKLIISIAIWLNI